MIDVLEKEEAGSVTVIALGPLTNVATAHKLNPAVFSRAKRVLWMGAAIDVPGNTTPCAEFNLFADPYAGAYLFSLPPAEAVNIVVCPLDITTPHAVPFPILMRDEAARGKSPLLDFVVAFLGRVRGIYESLGLGDAMEMHDPMVVWYAIGLAGTDGNSSNGFETTRRFFAVERVGELTRGLCVVDRRGTEETLLEDRSKQGIVTSNGHAGEPKEKVADVPSGKPKGIEVLTKTPGTDVFQREFERLVLSMH